jgi:hypothetical protein
MFHVERFFRLPLAQPDFKIQSRLVSADVPRGTFRCSGLWKPSADIVPTSAIHAKYDSLVLALESGIAKAVNSNYAALKSLGSP